LTVNVFVDAPTHVPVAAPVALMNILASVSENAALVSATPFVFVIAKSIWLVPPSAIVGVTKVFTMVGATAVTVSVAVLDTAPTGVCALETPEVVFGKAPGVFAVTSRVTVQLPLAGIVSPLKVSVPV
jgi:hypothetical protein